MATPQTTARAEKIGSGLTSKIMLDPITIITIIVTLLPYLIECFDPSDGEEAMEYVKTRYDENKRNDAYKGYDKRLLKGVTRQARRAARKEKCRLTWDQAAEIAAATLDDIRLGDVRQTSLVIRELGV